MRSSNNCVLKCSKKIVPEEASSCQAAGQSDTGGSHREPSGSSSSGSLRSHLHKSLLSLPCSTRKKKRQNRIVGFLSGGNIPRDGRREMVLGLHAPGTPWGERGKGRRAQPHRPGPAARSAFRTGSRASLTSPRVFANTGVS